MDFIHKAAKHVSDNGVRAALEEGLAAAVKAIEKSAENKVRIVFTT